MYNITFQQINTFLTVAKCMNLSKAAELLSYSQPALSKTLRKLEESVGITLFSRSNQGMHLTADGEHFFSVVEPLYNNINQSIHNVQLNAQLPAKVLRIIAPSLFDYSDDYNSVRDIISRYEKKYTDVLIQERLCDFAELREALYTDRADIVISENFALLDMQDIEIRHINSTEIYLMISSKHRLAQSDELDFSALSRETLYIISMLDEEADTRTQLDICDQLGVKPKKIEVMPNFQTILHNVNLGKGFSLTAKLKNIVPESSVRYYPIMRMKTPSVVVAWRKGMLNRHARNFINMLPEADDIPPDDQAAAP